MSRNTVYYVLRNDDMKSSENIKKNENMKKQIKYGLVKVNSWSTKRHYLVTNTHVGLRITDDQCGGVFSCSSCRRRVQEVCYALKNLSTTYWWQKYENGHWIMLERTKGIEALDFLSRSLWLSLNDAEWVIDDYGPIPNQSQTCSLPEL